MNHRGTHYHFHFILVMILIIGTVSPLQKLTKVTLQTLQCVFYIRFPS